MLTNVEETQKGKKTGNAWYGVCKHDCHLRVFIVDVHVISFQVPEQQPITLCSGAEDTKHYEEGKKCVEELALYLKPLSSARGSSCFVSFDNESWKQRRCETNKMQNKLSKWL